MSDKKTLSAFQRYFDARKEREENKESIFEQSLEKILITSSEYLERKKFVQDNLAKSAVSIGPSMYISLSGNGLVTLDECVDQLSNVATNLMSIFPIDEYHAALRKAEQEVTKNYFSGNLNDLVSCAVELAKTKEDNIISDNEKEFTYSRFKVELQALKDRGYFVNMKNLDYILRIITYPKDEDIKKFKVVVRKLINEKFMLKRIGNNLVDLIERKPIIRKKDIEKPSFMKREHRYSKEKITYEDSSERIEFMKEIFEIDETTALKYVNFVDTDSIVDLFDSLTNVFGSEDITQGVVQINPDVLTYNLGGKLGKYLATLRSIERKVSKNEGIGHIQEKFSFVNRLRECSSLEGALGLKEELDSYVSTNIPLFDDLEEKDSLDLLDYKNWLVSKAGMDYDFVRAFTEGKNRLVVRNVFSVESIRKNSAAYVSQDKLSTIEDHLKIMVSKGAMLMSRNGRGYALNEHISDIEDPYLKEYMRLVLFEKMIIAQEGELSLGFSDEYLSQKSLEPDFFF